MKKQKKAVTRRGAGERWIRCVFVCVCAREGVLWGSQKYGSILPLIAFKELLTH